MGSRDYFYIYDKPVPFKGLEIHPALVTQYYEIHYYADCLLLEQDAIKDVKILAQIISMSYLEFLFWSTRDAANEENNYIYKLHKLLCLVFRREFEVGKDIYYGYDENNRAIIRIDDTIEINGQDFDELREIIAEMNLINLPDLKVQKLLRDKKEEAKRLRNKGGVKMAGLEDQLVSLSISTGFKLDYLYGLSIRKFVKMLERIDAKIHYELYMEAALNGFAEFKDRSVLRHWLSDLTPDKNEGLVALSEMESTVNMEKAKRK